MSQTLSARRRVLAVLCGGFVGTITRYLLSLAIQSWLGKEWPYDILTINLTGALVFAFIATLADTTILIGPTRRLFITTGFLGAYTTFSSLALGEILLFSKGAWTLALLYLTLSLCGGIVAILAGDWFAQAIVQRLRRATRRTTALLEQQERATRHLTIQDDLVLPGKTDEFESRIP
jgi:CrcB protein